MGGRASTPARTRTTVDCTRDPLRPSDLCAPGTLQTGDIVLLNGNSWSAWLTRWATWSNYSHVGLLHWRRLPGHGDRPVLCLWESTRTVDPLPCLLTGRPKSGARLVSFEARLLEYAQGSAWGDTHICVVPLQFQTEAARAKFEQLLTEFEDQTVGALYAGSASRLIAAAYPAELGTAHLDPSLHSYTCNQLVALTLVRARAFTSGLPDGQITLSGFVDGALQSQWNDLASTQDKNYAFRVVDPQRAPPTASVIPLDPAAAAAATPPPSSFASSLPYGGAPAWPGAAGMNAPASGPPQSVIMQL